MKKMMSRILAVCCASCAGLALAHGDVHRTQQLAAAASFEQKPFGIAAVPAKAQRTITVSMGDDMRFTPDTVTVRRGETVRIRIRNKGKVLHEMVLGSAAELSEHAALMKKFPNMEHDEPHMAHVQPGATAQIVWTFNRDGEVSFACLIPDHSEAGMVGRIKVLSQGH